MMSDSSAASSAASCSGNSVASVLSAASSAAASSSASALRRKLLSFEFYRSFGGSLSEEIFRFFSPAAAAFLDSRTRGRLRTFSVLPDEVGAAFAALVDLAAFREAGIAGVGVGVGNDVGNDVGDVGGDDGDVLNVGEAVGGGDVLNVGSVGSVGGVGGVGGTDDVGGRGGMGAAGNIGIAGGARVKSRSVSCGEVSESVSFDALSFDEIAAEREALLFDFLFDCRDPFGVPLLYLG